MGVIVSVPHLDVNVCSQTTQLQARRQDTNYNNNH